MLFAVLARAKRHRIEPWVYLTEVLVKLAAETSDLDALLPDQWAAAHPEYLLTYRLEETRKNAPAKKPNEPAAATANKRRANHLLKPVAYDYTGT